MRIYLMALLLSTFQTAFAATEAECLKGHFAACKEIFARYSSTSRRDGAVEFFSKVCNSDNLRVECQIFSTETSKTSQKLLDLTASDATSNAGMFAMTGKKFDKVYFVKLAK